jgi:hypothetical protein
MCACAWASCVETSLPRSRIGSVVVYVIQRGGAYAEFQLMRLCARLESHFLIVGFTRVHTFVTWDSHELTHNLTGSHVQTFVLDWKRHTHKGHTTRQQTATWAHTAGHKRDGHHMCAHLSFVRFTCVHTFCLWDAKDSQTQKSGMRIN